jgi:peptidoglycan-associated lipoprotein
MRPSGALAEPSGSPPGSAALPSPGEYMPSANLEAAHFDFDKYAIRPGDAKVLEADAAWLRSNTDLVLFEGHCDERGTSEYNLARGERRAKATLDFLAGMGIGRAD